MTDPHAVETRAASSEPAADPGGPAPLADRGETRRGKGAAFGVSGRVLGTYALAFVLLLLLDAGRAAPMLARQAAELDLPLLRSAGESLSTVARAGGFAALARFESRMLAGLAADRTLGAVPAPASAGVFPSRQQLSAPPAAEGPAVQAPARLSASASGGGSGRPPSPVDAALAEFRNGGKGGTAQGAGQGGAAPPAASSGNSAPAAPSPPAKPRMLLIGDSMMMEGFGPVLQRTLRSRPDLEVMREGKYSTGLSRVDYFDWSNHLAELVERFHPDLVVICLGANDPQDIIDEDGKRHHADSASWAELYRARAEKLLRVATARGARVIWVGLPIMSKEPYSTRIRRLGEVQRAACETYMAPGQEGRARFVDTLAALADAGGRYAAFAADAAGQPVRLRYKDKVHVTEEGGRRMTAVVLPFILGDLGLPETPPEPESAAAPAAATPESAGATPS